jgi:hypothetical protein
VSWFITGAVGEFLAEAGDFLRAEPVRNTVVLSVTENLRVAAAARLPRHPSHPAPPAGDEPLLGWWRPGPPGNPGPVRGAFLHTPGFPVFLTQMPGEAVTGLAGKLAASGRRVRGLNAEAQAAQAFADAWRRSTGTLPRCTA